VAKARRQSNTSEWVLLSKAVELAVEFYQSPPAARRYLLEWLRTGQLHWRCHVFDGRTVPTNPKPGASEFWHEFADLNQHSGQVVLQVNWEQSTARRDGMFGYSAIRIEVPCKELQSLIPSLRQRSDREKWILDEAERMPADEIPEKITDWAKILVERMENAAKADPSIRPMKPRSVENTLRAAKLWPRD